MMQQFVDFIKDAVLEALDAHMLRKRVVMVNNAST